MTPRLTVADLVEGYHRYGKPPAQWRIGGEFERALVTAQGEAVPYFGEHGIRWLLSEIAERDGWATKMEGPNPIELKKAGAFLTLEPGSQVELTGAPYHKLSDLAAEVAANKALVYAAVEGLDRVWISGGLTPYATIVDIPFVPKGRYDVMKEYLPRQGELAHWMMKGTCSVQVNFDYQDEADAAEKFHLSLDLAPLNTALFANSPIAEGRDTGFVSFRSQIWTRTDAARTGFPPGVREGYTHAGWVDYLLDRPMMFILKDGRWTPAHGVTFRAWMTEGLDGHFPSWDDWELHQTSVFPEVRVKKTIEIRSADAVSAELGVAFCAFWTGLLYPSNARKAARAVADAFLTGSTHEERQQTASREGLEGTFGARTGAAWGRELVAIARAGLVEWGEDPSLLAPLEAVVEEGVSPGRKIQRAFASDPSPANILPLYAY